MEYLKKAVETYIPIGIELNQEQINAVATMRKYAQMLVDCKGIPEPLKYSNSCFVKIGCNRCIAKREEESRLYDRKFVDCEDRFLSHDKLFDKLIKKYHKECTIAHVASQSKLLEENKRLRGGLILILPLAKGYVASNNVGSNQKYIEVAEALTKEEG